MNCSLISIRLSRMVGVSNGIIKLFISNMIRLLPKKVSAIIFRDTWPVLPIFKLIQKKGHMEYGEMFKTFNMGIGMTVVLPRDEILSARDYLLKKYKLKSWVIGEILQGKKRVEII